MLKILVLKNICVKNIRVNKTLLKFLNNVIFTVIIKNIFLKIQMSNPTLFSWAILKMTFLKLLKLIFWSTKFENHSGLVNSFLYGCRRTNERKKNYEELMKIKFINSMYMKCISIIFSKVSYLAVFEMN